MICPNCQIDAAITEQLYGALYTCSGCRAVYFINFAGQPEFGEVTEEILTDMVSEPAAIPADVMSETINAQEVGGFESSYEASLEPLIDSVDMVNFDNKLEDQFNTQVDVQTVETQEAPDVGVENTGNSFNDVAREISDFGNTESQIAGLNYDLKITGLDTHETKRLFQEAIADSKLGWDTNEIMKKIINGQIEFEKLNPVKAYILAKRLQFLDIEKHWQQNAMS